MGKVSKIRESIISGKKESYDFVNNDVKEIMEQGQKIQDAIENPNPGDLIVFDKVNLFYKDQKFKYGIENMNSEDTCYRVAIYCDQSVSSKSMIDGKNICNNTLIAGKDNLGKIPGNSIFQISGEVNLLSNQYQEFISEIDSSETTSGQYFMKMVVWQGDSNCNEANYFEKYASKTFYFTKR